MQTAALTMTRKTWTDGELETLPRDGHKYELLDGDLIMSPVYANHGKICMRIGAMLFNFAESRKLGEVYDSSTGFRLTDDLSGVKAWLQAAKDIPLFDGFMYTPWEKKYTLVPAFGDLLK